MNILLNSFHSPGDRRSWCFLSAKLNNEIASPLLRWYSEYLNFWRNVERDSFEFGSSNIIGEETENLGSFEIEGWGAEFFRLYEDIMEIRYMKESNLKNQNRLF